MPDADGFPTPDEIISGSRPLPLSEEYVQIKLTPEQAKAISLITSGKPYIVIAAAPTYTDGESVSTGADIFTSLGGDPEVLRAIQPSLPNIIDRLYQRKGII